MNYSMSLLCGIKQHQLPVSFIELEIEQITEEEDWDLIEIIKVYVVKCQITVIITQRQYYIYLAI
jgi:hypothetical protein